MIRGIKRACIMYLLLAAAALSTACGGKAAVMKLVQTAGSVLVCDGGEKELDAAAGMKLYSGYRIGTEQDSYAWIDLDAEKCAKMDQNSEIEILRSGKMLQIQLNSGSLYFSVDKPLEEDESMSIRTSTMAVGIRGTCGWMETPAAGRMQVYILEGKVECSITDEKSGEKETAIVMAGETAVMSLSEGQMRITVDTFDRSQIPDFVMEEEPPIPQPEFVAWRDAGLEDHVMEWGDEGLERGVRRRTMIEEGDIMLSDVWEITDFGNALLNQGIKDISALGELTNIRYLYLDGNQISDITALGNLTNMENLILDRNQISDISPLQGMRHLCQLMLADNQIEDISALEGMRKLTRLGLADNRIRDISALRNLSKLIYLDLENNRIEDISVLAELTWLDTALLKNNRISDISVLSGLEHLYTLTLEGNEVTDYSEVKHLLAD